VYFYAQQCIRLLLTVNSNYSLLIHSITV